MEFGGNVSGQTTYAPMTRNLTSGQADPMFFEVEAVFFNILLGILFIFGVSMNCITIAVIATTPRLNSNIFNVFLMSLCGSDLTSAAVSIFMSYRLTYGADDFKLQLFICKITLAVDLTTTSITILHITAFSVLRLSCIKFPLKMIYFTRKMAINLAVTLWTIPSVSIFPLYLLVVDIKPGYERQNTAFSCAIAEDWVEFSDDVKRYTFPPLIFVPMGVIFVCSIIIIVMLIKKKRDQFTRKRIRLSKGQVDSRRSNRPKVTPGEDAALLQISLILLSFFTGYAPFFGYAYEVMRVMTNGKKFTGRSAWLLTVWAYASLRFSEFMNPIFYNVSSSNLRKATKKFLRKYWTKITCNSKDTTKVPNSRMNSAAISTISGR